MAVIKTLANAVQAVNVLYNTSSTPPNPGEEDYLIWTQLMNIAIDNWESEEGMLWRELFTKLASSPDGDKVTTTANSYAVPALFRFPSSAYVWLGDGTTKTPYKVVKQEEISLMEDNTGNWCYFLMDGSPTLEFNPNIGITAGQTINYNYYKSATAVANATDVFEMSCAMYAVYYAISELKKDEGDVSALQLMNEQMEGMKTLNFITADFQNNTTQAPIDKGFGVIGNYPIPKA